MQIYNNGISKELCSEIYDWAQSYVFGKPDLHPEGYPNPVVTRTNYSWHQSLMQDISPVIIYSLTDKLSAKLNSQISNLGLIDKSYTDFVPMVFVWTPGSYIPTHNDGSAENVRKVFTLYLNEEWSANMGGLFCFTNSQTGEVETLVPDQGMLVYNNADEPHYTTAVEPGYFRYSVQVFSTKS